MNSGSSGSNGFERENGLEKKFSTIKTRQPRAASGTTDNPAFVRTDFAQLNLSKTPIVKPKRCVHLVPNNKILPTKRCPTGTDLLCT